MGGWGGFWPSPLLLAPPSQLYWCVSPPPPTPKSCGHQYIFLLISRPPYLGLWILPPPQSLLFRASKGIIPCDQFVPVERRSPLTFPRPNFGLGCPDPSYFLAFFPSLAYFRFCCRDSPFDSPFLSLHVWGPGRRCFLNCLVCYIGLSIIKSRSLFFPHPAVVSSVPSPSIQRFASTSLFSPQSFTSFFFLLCPEEISPGGPNFGLPRCLSESFFFSGHPRFPSFSLFPPASSPLSVVFFCVVAPVRNLTVVSFFRTQRPVLPRCHFSSS